MVRFTCTIGAVLVAALSIPAVAQMGHGHPPPGAYDPYVGIKNKDGESCCNGQDCRQALPEELFDILRGGGYRVRAGTDIPAGTIIPEGKVANSPDGNWHICMSGSWNGTRWDPRGGKVRCLLLPVGGV
jgi:hypothetical protein